MLNGLTVVHVPYTFFPDPSAGTEIYVSALITAMKERHGCHGVVAAPGATDSSYAHNGIPVFRFRTGPECSLDSAYGTPDEVAAQSFRDVLRQVRPQIVHLHAHTAAVSVRLMEEAKCAGAKTVFTYHTPTVSCLRGTMMFLGKRDCDGVLDVERCSVCTLHKYGVPLWAGRLAFRIPPGAGELMQKTGISGPVLTAARLPALAAQAHGRFHLLMEKADRVIAVCQWVKKLLADNGVPESKLVLCRQGLPAEKFLPPLPRNGNGRNVTGDLRLGYFGRLDPSKGLDTVIEALEAIPGAPVKLDIFAVEQPGSAAYSHRLRRKANARVSFHSALPPESVPRAMAECDFVVVPSRWLETGPLVVYESFASGTPVLGTRAGGITELVRDGMDGILVADSSMAWAEVIAGLAGSPARVQQLRKGVRHPRTMTDAATEMVAHYRALIASDA